MKTLGLVLALVIVASGACVAANVTYDIFDGWNLVCAPLVPFNPDPNDVFDGAPYGVDGLLTRFDAPSSGNITYDSLDPQAFGNILLGDGYWLYSYGGGTIDFDGVPDGVPDGSGNMTDMWISLPGNQLDGQDAGGWHLIGHPFNHDTPVDDGSGTGANIYFTDGTTLKNWSEAAAAGWVADAMITYDNVAGNLNVQFDGLGDDDTLRPAHGYWLFTYKDNLAMIIPAYTP